MSCGDQVGGSPFLRNKREMYVQSLMGGCGSAHLLPELRRQRQEDHEFEVSMRYVMRILLGNGKEEKKDKKEM